METVIQNVALSSTVFLGALGALAAYAGGAKVLTGAMRVMFWGMLAMGLTALVGNFFGVQV